MAHLKKNERRTKKEQQCQFLESYCETGNISASCIIVKVARKNHYNWFEKDKAYKKAFLSCGPMALGIVEDEMNRRAVKGVDEPVYHQGKIVGSVKKYSDTLLIFLAKAIAPNKYRDNYRNEEDGDDDNLGKTVKVTLKLT